MPLDSAQKPASESAFEPIPARAGWDSKDWVWLSVLVALIAVGYCPLLFVESLYTLDSASYLSGASGLAHGNGYSNEFLERVPRIGMYPPMQSVWLSFWWRLGGEFPGNLPWLLAGSFVLGAAAVSLGFLYWRSIGISRRMAALLMLVWAASPSWIGMQRSFLSDPGFTAVLLVPVLIWIRIHPARSLRAWLATGVVMAIAYLWRAAGLAVIGALGGVTLLSARSRQWRPLIAFSLPVLVALVGWNLMSRSAASYGSGLNHWFQQFGGRSGYVGLLWYNAKSCLLGDPIWEMMIPAVVRFPGWIHAPAAPTMAYKIVTAGFLWTLLGIAFLHWIRNRRPLENTIALAALAYILQISVMPWPASHFYRYYFVLVPFAVGWAWKGMNELRRPAVLRAARTVYCGLMAFALLSNVGLSAVVARRSAAESLGELRAAANWARQNIRPSERLAVGILLPIPQWVSMTGRRVLVDYLDPRWEGIGSVRHADQRYPRADYVLCGRDDLRAQRQPEMYRAVYTSPHGEFRLLRVEPASEAEFRKTHGIPHPS